MGSAVSFLPGCFPSQAMATGGIEPLLVDFGQISQTTNSYSFAGRAFGGADSTRVLILYAAWGIIGATNLSSATIGGVGATIVGQNDGTNTGSAIAYAAVPTGTTGTVAFTLSNNAVRAGWVLWRAVGLSSSVPTSSSFPAGGGGANRSATLTIEANGFAICGATDGGVSGITWTNATEVADFSDGLGQQGYGAAQFVTPILASGRVISANPCRVVAGAAWR